MKICNKILIVEDEAILFAKMSSKLIGDGYKVDEYTKSYEEAIERIEIFKPDLVLLDIELIGGKTGIDLGNVLYNKYNIPFIYITSFGDKKTFEKALVSVPELFLVKTKPNLDYLHLTNQMKVVLHKNSKKVKEDKKGIRVLNNYADFYFNSNSDSFKKKLLLFDSIVSLQTDYQRTNLRIIGRKNYLRITNKEGAIFYFQGSLSKIELQIPSSFCRISGSTIINLKGDFTLNISSRNDFIELNDDIKFKVSRSFKKSLKTKLANPIS